MEIGKYYIDGEGFYKVIGKENGRVAVDTVNSSPRGINIYCPLTLVEEACDRRMVECSKEVFVRAKEIATKAINELNDYNTEVFMPLWKEKHP